MSWTPAGWRECGNPECAAEWGPMPPSEFGPDGQRELCSVCDRLCQMGCGRTPRKGRVCATCDRTAYHREYYHRARKVRA